MHELAGCRLMTADGVVEGHVVTYGAGVLRLHVGSPGPVHAGEDVVAVEVLDPVRGECTYRGLVAKVLGTAVDVVVVETTGQRQRRSAARATYHVTCVATAELDDEVSVIVVVADFPGWAYSVPWPALALTGKAGPYDGGVSAAALPQLLGEVPSFQSSVAPPVLASSKPVLALPPASADPLTSPGATSTIGSAAASTTIVPAMPRPPLLPWTSQW